MPEVMYYICRREIVSGYKPPLVERAEELAENITALLEENEGGTI